MTLGGNIIPSALSICGGSIPRIPTDATNWIIESTAIHLGEVVRALGRPCGDETRILFLSHLRLTGTGLRGSGNTSRMQPENSHSRGTGWPSLVKSMGPRSVDKED